MRKRLRLIFLLATTLHAQGCRKERPIPTWSNLFYPHWQCPMGWTAREDLNDLTVKCKSNKEIDEETEEWAKRYKPQ